MVLVGGDIIFSGQHTLNIVASHFPADRRGYPKDTGVFTFRLYHMRGRMLVEGLVSNLRLPSSCESSDLLFSWLRVSCVACPRTKIKRSLVVAGSTAHFQGK